MAILMNSSQINFEQIRLWLEQRNLLLTSSQVTLIAIGTGVLVLLYLIFKFWQWRRRRARAVANAPKMRPRVKSPVSSSQSPSTPPPIKQVSSPLETLPTFAQPAVQTASQVEAQTAHIAEPERVFSGSADIPRKYTSNTYWPIEPKTLEKRNLFEESGEEYPWADGSDYTFGSATTVFSDLLPGTEDGRRKLTKTLRNAGYYTPHAWENLSAIRYLGIILPIILFGVLLVLVPESLESYAIAGLVIVPILGWALPTLYVRSRAAERLREIENAMPDMLDLLNMCVSQGMTVPASLRRVGHDIGPVYPALAKELTIVAEQARVGHLTEALDNFSDRVDTPEVHSFSSLMIQTEQMGTSVSEALNDYSDSMRESQKQRADEKANSATFKLLFPTVLCLMPAVFLFLMGPALIELNAFFAKGGLQSLDQGATQAIERQR